jgi:hypothetical protein
MLNKIQLLTYKVAHINTAGTLSLKKNLRLIFKAMVDIFELRMLCWQQEIKQQ